MARSLFYLCHLCNRTHRTDVTSAMDVCERCHGDHAELKTLYTRIVAKHPSLRKVPIGQVMARLWAWYEAHPAVQRDKEETKVSDLPGAGLEPIHIDDLKDIF